jgi:uncharacterized protein YlxW (UPF0749 family)
MTQPSSGPRAPGTGGSSTSGRPTLEPNRLFSHLLIAALCGILGYGLVIQVRRTDSGDTLKNARPQDLVVILDGLNRRSDQLNAEIADLQRTLSALRTGGQSSQAALAEAQRQASALAILAGTAPARGPGITMTMTDPKTAVSAELLLAALQELRNAGAEAIAINGVRIGLDTYFTGRAGAMVADGITVTAPYAFQAIGDPPTMTAAMKIPGGVSDTVRRAGGELTIIPTDASTPTLTIAALRTPRTNLYARPAGK